MGLGMEKTLKYLDLINSEPKMGTFATVDIRDSKNISTPWTGKGIYFKSILDESQIVNEQCWMKKK